MLKKTITYEDFNGVERTEDFYFNISKTELTELETSVDGGIKSTLEKMIAQEDVKNLFAMFKRIILMSVGLKSDDGRRFVKSDEIAQDFVSSPAFDVLFMELSTNEDSANAFITGILPKDLAEKVNAEQRKLDAEPKPLSNTSVG